MLKHIKDTGIEITHQTGQKVRITKIKRIAKIMQKHIIDRQQTKTVLIKLD